MRDHDCTTHPAGTKTCYDHCGCRCYDCSYARSVYVYQGQPHRVSGQDLARRVAEARKASGVSVVQVARDADVPPTTLYSIVNGDVESVDADRATQIIVACETLKASEKGRRIEARPILDAIDRHAAARDVGVRSLLGDADSRTYYRSAHRGWVSEEWADRVACEVLGLPLPLLYGTEAA